MYVTTDGPRPSLPTDRDPSDAERARAFNAFYATGGRFDRNDSTVTIRTDVAKYPNNMMNPLTFVQFWTVREDTLWLERRDAIDGNVRPMVRRT